MVQVSSVRWVFYEPICTSVPTGIVVRGWVWLQLIFLKILSSWLPISWWVIYECICPHKAECSVVFDQKLHDPQFLTLPIHPFSTSANFCLFPLWKKPSEGNVLPVWKRWNKKIAETLKGIKIDKFKNCFEWWKNSLIGVFLQINSVRVVSDAGCENIYK